MTATKAKPPNALTGRWRFVAKERVRQSGYPFDLFVVAEGATPYHEVIRLFHWMRDHPGRSKGFWRVRP
jgi:hypothetical protein